MLISQYHMIVPPYRIIKLPYHTIKSLDHTIKSDPMGTKRLPKPLTGLPGARLGTHLAPSPKSTHKFTKKTPTVIKKMSPCKR